MRCVTFGSFDVFVDGKLMSFKSGKAKELFALLVQKRGGIVTPEEAMAALYEDKAYDRAKSSTYRMVVMRLRESLEEAGMLNILHSPEHGRGKYIDADQIECDLYDYLDGDPKARGRFTGRYLSNYSWAEDMLGTLLSKEEAREELKKTDEE